MEEKENNNQTNENSGNGCAIALLVIFLIIFIPVMIAIFSSNTETSNKEKHIQQLTEEGKEKTSDEVINEIVKIFKDRNEGKLKEYLAESFNYIDNERYESKYTSDFWKDLKYLVEDSCETERRGDIHQDEMVNYWVYWNVVEENKKRGINRAESTYCLQKITITLRKVVKDNEITYEIEKIILTDN